MRMFSEFLTESKNLHMEHLEDSVFNEGSAGVVDAIRFLESVTHMLSSGDTGVRVTVKWDGAPAVFCGINPENDKFFVGTKSIFNKKPKINYTPADIDNNHSGQLADKLKTSLKYLSKLGITGVLQGDLLYTDKIDTQKIDGEIYYTFQPNTITYAVPVTSDLGKRIKKSKIGIVFHTNYKGNSMSDMSASFNPNVASLSTTPDVFFDDADIKDYSNVMITSSESKTINSLITRCKSLLRKSSNIIDHISSDTKLVSEIKTFTNVLIRQGSVQLVVDEFLEYMEQRLNDEIEKAKSERGKKIKHIAKKDFMRRVSKKKKELRAAFELHKSLSDAKIPVIRKLETIKTMGTFIKTNNGYKVTAAEGFVAINDGNKSYKLVDRLEFSRTNFTIAKDWD